ncbi:MAG: beta-galactosidase [Bacteroidales bacterium]|nr:beta-galactosidase [Bacteroidales bacterium]
MNKSFFAAVVAIACVGSVLTAAPKKYVWSPAGDNIKTKWASEVNPSAPLPEYPRPQLVRGNWLNLNGLWDYAITPEKATDFTAEGKILVPFAVESSLSGVGKHVGKENALWYERTFTVPKTWKGEKVLLHFGAVDWKADVWVNGSKAGSHTGGYTPFSFDITSLLKKSGKQTIRVRVWDATDQGWQPRGKQVESPQGIWYTPVTGIWQTVWLENVPSTRVEGYTVAANLEDNILKVNVDAANLKGADLVRVELLEGGIGYSAETPSTKVLAASDGPVAALKLVSPKLWSPDSPYLYGLRISIMRNGQVIDCVNGYTSVRTISKVKSDGYNRMALSGKPLFQYGPLDQGWWPDGLYTAPTDDALRFDVEKTREFGFNTIRKHIKVEPARWYYWCDALGVMVWQDMPCIADHSKGVAQSRDPQLVKLQANKWAHDSLLGGTDASVPQQWKDNYYKEWGEIIKALKVFQCIIVWVPFNEGWGQFDTPKVVEFTRSQDPTRLINESSGGNFVLKGDILDVHHYPGPMMNVFEGKLVNVLGEYGGIGLPVEGHLWKITDKNWGYGGVKKSASEVVEQYRAFAERLKVFVSTGCSAAIYTQTTDVEVEVNGLMTYDRMVKVPEAEICKINKSVIESMK